MGSDSVASASPIAPSSPFSTLPWVYSPREAAQVLNMSVEAVYDAIAQKSIPALRVGGRWKIPAMELHRQLGWREAPHVAQVRDELRRAQHDIRGVVAMAELNGVMASQLLEAVSRISSVIAALTAHEETDRQ